MTTYHMWMILIGRCNACGGIDGGGGVQYDSRESSIMAGGTNFEKRPDTANWDRMVDIIKTAFRDRRLPVECGWQMAVLLSKGNKELQGIGIVEVIWKAVLGVVNR